MSLIGKPIAPKIFEKWAKMSPGALYVMNIHDVYARIGMPAPPSGRLLQAFICDAIYVVFSEHRSDPKGGLSNHRLWNG
jgi:hypothetical protein